MVPAAPPSLCISMIRGTEPHRFGRSHEDHSSAHSPIGDAGEEDLQAVYVRRVLEEQLGRAWYTNSFFYEISDCGSFRSRSMPGAPVARISFSASSSAAIAAATVSALMFSRVPDSSQESGLTTGIRIS